MARPRSVDGPATPATVALDRLGVTYRRHPYAHDPAAASYGLEAAQALGVAPERVLKTLLVDTGHGLAVGIVPVAGQLDLKAMAAALGVKGVRMADTAAAERSTGYVVGGISPVGQRRALPTVLDESAFGHPTVYVSGGRRGFDLELAADDLVTVTRRDPRRDRPPGLRPAWSATSSGLSSGSSEPPDGSDAEALRPSQGVESTTVVWVDTFAAARIRASRSSRLAGVVTRTLRM